jgi:hypothetical protein
MLLFLSIQPTIVEILIAMVDIFMAPESNQKEYFCSDFAPDTGIPLNLHMKSRYSHLLLAAIIFLFASCTKENSNENGHGTSVQTGDFYATIDGILWNADSIQLIQVSNSGVSINGLSKTGEEISMVVPVFQTGTYPLGGLALSYAQYVNLLGNVAKVYSSDASTSGGSITISGIDTVNHLMSGSFLLNLVDLSDNSIKTITDGVFNNIPYSGNVVPVTPPPGTSADTLNATVDGSPFIGATVEALQVGDQLIIAGISSDGSKSIQLIMPFSITAGTYNLDFGTGNYIGVYYPSPTVPLVSQANGSITIISNNTATRRIKGTFSFVANPITSGTPATVTEGYFSLNY